MNLLIVFSVYVSLIYPIVLSLFGLSWASSDENPLYLIVVLGCNSLTCLYISIYEIYNYRKAKGSILPYFIPFIIFIIFIIENAISNTPLKENAHKELQFFFAFAMSGIFSAVYCYRYNKFYLFVKNLELLMFICSCSLIIALPKLGVSTGGIAQIGGGNHQAISYSSALAFGVLFCSLMTKSPNGRYSIFNSKFYKIVSVPILILLCIICLIGGGRGGVILMLINFFVCTYLLAKRNFINVILILVISAIAIYLFISFASPSLANLFDKGFERSFAFIGVGGNIDLQNGSSGRDFVYLKAIELIINSPFVGYGFFQQYDLCQKYLFQPYSHNIIIEILLQGGVIFLIIIGSFLIIIFKKLNILIKLGGNHIFLIPISSYPFIQLLFSNTYLCSPLFWFSIIFVSHSLSNTKHRTSNMHLNNHV